MFKIKSAFLDAFKVIENEHIKYYSSVSSFEDIQAIFNIVNY